MPFFDALKRLVSHGKRVEAEAHLSDQIKTAWGLDDPDHANALASGERPATIPLGKGASEYDRAQWSKRLKRLISGLPASRSQWQDLMNDAHALEIDPDWIAQQAREGFSFLVRQAVSDRVFTHEEHEKLDLARRLLELSEPEAAQIVHAIVDEAEKFFGAPITDEG
jgi:hypothetical protein